MEGIYRKDVEYRRVQVGDLKDQSLECENQGRFVVEKLFFREGYLIVV